MIVATELGWRSGSVARGSLCATRSSHFGYGTSAGASGRATLGRSSGKPAFISSQTSSLPTNRSFVSLCSKIFCAPSAESVAKNGTETWPAAQMARSAMTQWAQFFEQMPIWLGAGRFWAFSQVAMRRAWSMTSAQEYSTTRSPETGWIR